MPDPLQLPPVLDRHRHVDQGGAEAGRGVVVTPRDLDIRNVSRAIADGGLGARWELGAAIGRLLVGGEQR